MPNMNDILAVILGGGQGKRLYPLTAERAKPAVPIAGKYRLIDIPLSNCINSGIYHISVLTQFLSVSLHRHIARTYNFDSFHGGAVQIWAAEQTMSNTDWYQGTADAVRKQLSEIVSVRKSHVLILAGDHLYRMDYSEMAKFHLDNDADITVAVQPVPKREASRFGLLKLDPDNRIQDFAEKPKDPEILASFISRDDLKVPIWVPWAFICSRWRCWRIFSIGTEKRRNWTILAETLSPASPARVHASLVIVLRVIGAISGLSALSMKPTWN